MSDSAPSPTGAKPVFDVATSRYDDELGSLRERTTGPVLQIGSRTQILDTKAVTWRQRFADRSFVGADLEAGDNVDAVFDVCAPFGQIDEALGGRRFGLILLPHLLEHVRQPHVAAANVQQLLAPGGHVFVQVPWVQCFHPFPDDYWRLSLSALELIFDRLATVDAFYSGGSSDVAYRVHRDGRPDRSRAARAMEAKMFQILLGHQQNRVFLAGLAERRLYLSRGYVPAMIVNYLGRLPQG